MIKTMGSPINNRQMAYEDVVFAQHSQLRGSVYKTQ